MIMVYILLLVSSLICLIQLCYIKRLKKMVLGSIDNEYVIEKRLVFVQAQLLTIIKYLSFRGYEFTYHAREGNYTVVKDGKQIFKTFTYEEIEYDKY